MSNHSLNPRNGNLPNDWVTYFLPQENMGTLLYGDWHKEESPFSFRFSSFNGQNSYFLSYESIIIRTRTIEKELTQEYSDEILEESEEQHQDYLQMVEKALAKINAGELQKIVLARKISLPLSKTIDFSELLSFLRVIYPKAFVYALKINEQTWFGASPETLLSKRGHQIQTMALAGTKKIFSKDETWSEKDQNEQQVVEEYITSKILESNISYQKNGPYTHFTGNLYHIRTDIEATHVSQDLALELVEKLHPTPAVSGFPKENAIKAIQQIEQEDRGYYSGLVGVLQGSDLDLFVNLRCGYVEGNHLHLFAGAGINANSEPEKEWQETHHKLGTLLKPLFQLGYLEKKAVALKD